MHWFIISLAVFVAYTQNSDQYLLAMEDGTVSRAYVPGTANTGCLDDPWHTARSPPRPHCGPLCRMGCPNGFVRDERGCEICKCRPLCPMIECVRPCRNGFVTNSDGCVTCRCKPGPFPPLPIRRECPAGSKSNIQCPFAIRPECETDSDCPYRKKCCMYGCSKRCVYPRRRDYFPGFLRIEDPFV